MISTTSARLAIAVATANGHRAPEWCADVVQNSNKYDSIPAILHGLDAGRILAAVDTCPEPVRAWLLVCYAADGYAPRRYLHIVTSNLYLEHARRRTVRMIPAHAANIAGAVITDMLGRCRNPERLPARPGEYTKAVGLKSDRYQDIMPMVESMQGVIETWDGAGLKVVASELPFRMRERAA